MKIRAEILSILSGRQFMLLKYKDALVNEALKIKTDNAKPVKCYACEKTCSNWCWNCEKPHCDEHAVYLLFHRFPIMLTFCLECNKEFIKLIENAPKLKSKS